MAEFHSWWTVVLLVVFVGIVVWAWSGKRKKHFEQAARIPLDDDDEPRPETRRPTGDDQKENRNA